MNKFFLMRILPIVFQASALFLFSLPVAAQDAQDAFLGRLDRSTWTKERNFPIESLDDLKGLDAAALLDALKRNKRPFCISVACGLVGSIRPEDLPELAKRLDSTIPCSHIHPAWSSFTCSAISSEGAEAAQMILGFANRHYPFVLNLTEQRKTELVKEAKEWLVEHSNESGAPTASFCSEDSDLYVVKLPFVKQPDYQEWLSTVSRRIRLNWYPPRDYNPCTVTFFVASDGSISKLRISSSSGQVNTDQSALAAVAKAQPFPSLPGARAPIEVVFKF